MLYKNAESENASDVNTISSLIIQVILIRCLSHACQLCRSWCWWHNEGSSRWRGARGNFRSHIFGTGGGFYEATELSAGFRGRQRPIIKNSQIKSTKATKMCYFHVLYSITSNVKIFQIDLFFVKPQCLVIEIEFI